MAGDAEADPAGSSRTIAGVAGELTYPILPCADLDVAIDFYVALGFACTYRQRRPNPYGVVARDDLQVHLSGIDGFDASTSYASAIVVVPDLDTMYADFAAGLRHAYGKLPSAGIPRILRPRKKHGTVRGFSVVDPGGNWLRFVAAGVHEDDEEEPSTGLARIIDNAARLADARGDDAAGIKLLQTGVQRFADASAVDRVRALAYLAELQVRVGDLTAAQQALDTAEALPVDEPADVADVLRHARELVDAERPIAT